MFRLIADNFVLFAEVMQDRIRGLESELHAYKADTEV